MTNGFLAASITSGRATGRKRALDLLGQQALDLVRVDALLVAPLADGLADARRRAEPEIGLQQNVFEVVERTGVEFALGENLDDAAPDARRTSATGRTSAATARSVLASRPRRWAPPRRARTGAPTRRAAARPCSATAVRKPPPGPTAPRQGRPFAEPARASEAREASTPSGGTRKAAPAQLERPRARRARESQPARRPGSRQAPGRTGVAAPAPHAPPPWPGFLLQGPQALAGRPRSPGRPRRTGAETTPAFRLIF